jgi:glycyl-tRNA synthetase (class II)
MQAGGQLVLPVEIFMTVAQHTQDFEDLVVLCSTCRSAWSASKLIFSHWLQSRKLETSLEVSEPHALGFLHTHTPGKPITLSQTLDVY